MTLASLSCPAWFGKLPGAGDFAHRRLPAAVRTRWDEWLHDGLANLRVRHPAWIEAYLTSPVWGFLLGAGVVDDDAWIGVMAPSVDRVGRYYPITVFAPLATDAPTASWWQVGQGVLLQALDSDADAPQFEALLSLGFGRADSQAVPPIVVSPPRGGHSIWSHALDSQPSAPMETNGLPCGPQFDCLFDLGTTGKQMEEPL